MGARLLRFIPSFIVSLGLVFGFGLAAPVTATAGGGVDPGCTTIGEAGVGYIGTIVKRGGSYRIQNDMTGGGVDLTTTKTSVVASVNPDATLMIELHSVEAGGQPFAAAADGTVTFPKMKGKNAEAYLCGSVNSYPPFDCTITGTNDTEVTKDFYLNTNRYQPESITMANPGWEWTLAFVLVDRFETVTYEVVAADQVPDPVGEVVTSGTLTPLDPPAGVTCTEHVWPQA